MSTTDEPRCASCGSTKGEGQQGNSRSLLDCSGCLLTKYCSKECQKSDWKLHKHMCKIAQKYPASSKALKLVASKDDDQFLDFDAILKYAEQSHMQIEHFSINIRQECLIRSLMGQYNKEWVVKLTPGVLRSFLESQTNTMLSFIFDMDDCCWEYTKRFTDSGRAFMPLARMSQLESFQATHPVFDRADDLQALLNPLNLKRLALISLTFDGQLGDPWNESDALIIARCAGSMTNLINLNFNDCHFRSPHVGIILSNLPNLRCLDLSGQFGQTVQRTSLEDTDFRFISQSCPKLQKLDLSYHRSCTFVGVEAVLQGCPSLREFDASDIRIPWEKLLSLLRLNKKLLLFRCCCNIQSQSMERETIMTTGGRTLVLPGFGGLLEAPGLPSAVEQEIARSKAALDEASDRMRDDSSRVYNEYEAIELIP